MKNKFSFLCFLIAIFFQSTKSAGQDWYIQLAKNYTTKFLVKNSKEDKVLGSQKIPKELDFLGVLPNAELLFYDYYSCIYAQSGIDNRIEKKYSIKCDKNSFVEQVQVADWCIYFLIDHNANDGGGNPKYSLLRYNYQTKNIDTLYYKEKKGGVVRSFRVSNDNIFYAEIIEKITSKDKTLMQTINLKNILKNQYVYSNAAFEKNHERFVYDNRNVLGFGNSNDLIFIRQSAITSKEKILCYSIKKNELHTILDSSKGNLMTNGFLVRDSFIYTCIKNYIYRCSGNGLMSIYYKL